MRQHISLRKDEEANVAAWEAARGAVVGAAKWGLATAVLGAAGYVLSPIYRGLTVQFKVFLQMSGMTVGSMIEADRRLREYEVTVRRNKKLARDAAVWDRYETLYEQNVVGRGVVGMERKEGVVLGMGHGKEPREDCGR